MSNPTRTLFRHAARALTLQGNDGPRCGAAMSDLAVVEDAALVVEGAQIVWVGADRDLPATYASDEFGAIEVDAQGKVLMPALVDAHTHLVWGGDRRDEMQMRLAGADYEDIFAAGGGILSSVRQTRELDEDALYTQSLRRIERMRRAGTTSFEIKSGYGLDLETELRQLRVARRLGELEGFRVKTTCLAAHALPEDARRDPRGREAFVARVCEEIFPAVVKESLADYADVFCDRGAFTADEARKVLLRARELGLEFRVHANEFGHTGGALVAGELGAKSADHLLHLNAEERKALREGGVSAVLLPGTSLVLGKDFADGRAMIEDGLAVVVATDCNPGSCAIENLMMVLSLACYGCRLSPAEALCAVTHNAAASLGLSDTCGRLEAGMAADILMLASDDERDLVYHAGSPLIDGVWAAGRRVD